MSEQINHSLCALTDEQLIQIADKKLLIIAIIKCNDPEHADEYVVSHMAAEYIPRVGEIIQSDKQTCIVKVVKHMVDDTIYDTGFPTLIPVLYVEKYSNIQIGDNCVIMS